MDLEAGSLKIQLGLWLPRLLCLQEAPDLVNKCCSPGPHTLCVAQNQQEMELLDWGLRCLILEIVSLWKLVWVNQCYYIVWVLFFFSLFSPKFLEPNIISCNCSFSGVFLLEAAAGLPCCCWAQSTGDSAANEQQDLNQPEQQPSLVHTVQIMKTFLFWFRTTFHALKISKEEEDGDCVWSEGRDSPV